MSVDPDDPVPIYAQVAALLEGRIDSGEISRRMPSIKDVQAEYGVAQGTAERAYRLLRERGRVIVVEGRGHWVNPS